MDFLNQAYAQLSELFTSMSMGARLIAGLLLTIVVVSLSYLFTHQVSNPDAYLLGARVFTDGEIAATTAAFSQAGLNNWDTQGNRLRVPRSKKHIYLAALAENNAMPKGSFQYIAKAVEGNGVFKSQQQLKDELKIGQEQELSFVIRKMSGIDDAVVKFQSTVESAFPHKTKKITAAVSVWPTPRFHFSDQQVNSIQKMVASSIGADPKAVGVFDMVAGKQRSLDLDEDGRHSSDYQIKKEDFETHFVEKALRTLSYIPDVIVAVNVDLDDTSHFETWKKELDPTNAVAVQTNNTTESESTTMEVLEGEPGVVPQRPNTQAEVRSTSTEKSTRKKTIKNINKIPSETITEERKVPMTPQKVTATVSVPKSYYREVWRKQNPTLDGEEPRTPSDQELENLEKNLNSQIQDAVVNILPPKPPGGNKYEPVVVVSFEPLSKEERNGPAFSATSLSWLAQNWSTLGMMMIGVFSLIMLRSMVRSIPASTTPTPSASSHTVDRPPTLGIVSPEDAKNEKDNPEKVLQRSMSGPNLRDELVEMVRDDPDAAAKVVSSWIGNVG